MKNLAIASALAFAAASLPAGAQLYSNPVLQGATSSPGSVSFAANSAGGAGALSFAIDGFASLDGVNFYEDDFTLDLNGTTILSLSYDLGGGGANAVFTDLYGATITGGTNGFFQGGQLQVSIAGLLLAAGANTFTFTYDSPTGGALGDPLNGHAGPQGSGDEAWGISDVLLTGPAVPEPATWGMMILGFGAVGATLRRRSTRVAFAG